MCQPPSSTFLWFCLNCAVVLTFASVDVIQQRNAFNAIEQHLPVVMFIVQYNYYCLVSKGSNF